MLVAGLVRGRRGAVSAGRRVERTPLPARPLAAGRVRRGRSGLVVRRRCIGGGCAPTSVVRPSPDPAARRVPPVGVLVGAGARRRRAAAARSAPPPVPAHAATSSRGGGGRVIELRDVRFAYDEDAPGPRRRRPDHRGGRARRSSPAAPASASRRCSACSPGWCRASPAARSRGDVLLDGRQHRAHRRRASAPHVVGLRRPGPGRRVRHRHRRGGARLRHGAARPAPAHHAPPGRGDPRPARHRRPARAATCARCRAGSSSGSRSARC